MAPSLIIVTAEGWGEKEICAKGVSDSKKLAKGWGWGSESIDCTSIMGCITNNTNFNNNKQLIHWKCGHCGGGGGLTTGKPKVTPLG